MMDGRIFISLAWTATCSSKQCDGTFTDVTAEAGLADGRWSTGAALGDCWPSGKIETLGDLAADQDYSILERQGLVSAERIRPAPRKR
jgi:hypothetical protein